MYAKFNTLWKFELDTTFKIEAIRVEMVKNTDCRTDCQALPVNDTISCKPL